LLQSDEKSQKKMLSKFSEQLVPGLCELLVNIRAGNLGKKPGSADMKLIDAVLNTEKKKRLVVINKSLVSGQLSKLLRVFLKRYDKRGKEDSNRRSSTETTTSVD
jgi:hypothetical protein